MTSASPSLLMRADASREIGSGHIMRCLALAKAWQSGGGTVCCTMAESIPALENRLTREGIVLKQIDAEAGTTADLEMTVAEARLAKAARLVVDGYRFGPDYLRQLRAAGIPVLFLDDDGRFEFYTADVVLNQNISANADMYLNRESFTQLLLGSQFALLRPEFLAESRTREHPEGACKVLVTMGGSDPNNVTRKVLLALSRTRTDLETTIVLGSGYSQASELRSLVKQLSLNICVEQNPEDMAPLMRWADVAISGAGGTCWELGYSGLPSIVIALSRDQQGIARGLAENGIAVSLGWHANLSEERIGEALSSLLVDREGRREMSERGRELVDGQGAARVVRFLKNSL
jgi:UDP-2,4-diacetamido-2,4,6-trideoxy-beta-L-altropyranose hydrolase